MTAGKVARGRTYERRFDWDDARRRRAAGESVTALAREYGVSTASIYLATDEEQLAKSVRRASAWQRSHKCVECGAQAYKRARDHKPRCRRCASRAAAVTVRQTELQCVTCHEWKPDAAFSSNRGNPARRDRHRQCRECNTAWKREWRARKATA